MKSRLISKISRYYNNKINKFGASPKGVDWNDVISQQIRFKQLTKIIDINKPITISDLGCGYGAYYLYLSQELSQTVQKYCGYDISDNMLNNDLEKIDEKKNKFLNNNKNKTNIELKKKYKNYRYCKTTGDCLLTKKELCRAIANNYMIRTNVSIPFLINK